MPGHILGGTRSQNGRCKQKREAKRPERLVRGDRRRIVAWDEEEGEARLSADDGEREMVVPVGALET